MTMPERLRSLRARLKWSQQDLAVALDVTVSTISRWENGKTEPHRLAVEALEQLEVTYGGRRPTAPAA